MKDKHKKFIDGPEKAITLMGMSGVGKTYLSEKLAGWGWKHYSCDVEIGTNILQDDIIDTIKQDLRAHPSLRLFLETGAIQVNNNITVDNLGTLAAFIGRLGNPVQGRVGNVDHGGLDVAEFKRRQQLYYKAECQSLLKVQDQIAQAKSEGISKFVNDSTGSMCEIDDPAIIKQVGENTLIVYIKATKEEEQEVIKRSVQYPKPLLYPGKKFDVWLETYMQDKGLASSDDIEPDDFLRTTFSWLLEHRIPIYDQIAAEYGITVSSDDFKGIESEEAFLDVIRHA